jgi:chromosomal replication initiator protein
MTDLWGQAVRAVEEQVKPAHRELWLRPIKCVSMGNGRIRLQAPNRYHKEWFEDNVLPTILEDLHTRTQTAFQVDFDVLPDEQAPAPALVATHALAGPTPVASLRLVPRSATAPVAAPQPNRELDSRFGFDKFVVGPGNEFAHSAARTAAESPAARWNPLFIFGGTGLGKTHLLHAIGHEIARQHPDWTIRVVTCEQFVSGFIGSIVNQRKQMGPTSPMEQFRTRYREEPDVLLIDDIQFLSKKDSSQDEFFHTFNSLHHAHKQIVLTSDKLPSELAGIDERLTSRFGSGLVVEICRPDFDTRAAIVRRKAEVMGIDIPEDVVQVIAARVNTNVRQLEGALLHVSARATLCGQRLTREFAEEVLRGLIATASPSTTVEAIQREVATHFNVQADDLRGTQRHRAIAHPRMVAMYLTRRLTSLSYPEIGERFGGKDHSTVINAVKKIERLVAEDVNVKSVVGRLEDRLRREG